MKFVKGILLLFAVTCFSACAELSGDLSMSCKVDGTTFDATLVVATIKDDVLVVTGTGGSDKQCQIFVRNCTATGTYEINLDHIEDYVGGWTSGLEVSTDVFLSSTGTGTGSIVISKLTDKKVEGTFQFTARNSEGTEVNVTDGSFQATITK